MPLIITRSSKNLRLRKSPLHVTTHRDLKSRPMFLLMNTRDFESASRDQVLNYRFSKVKLPLAHKESFVTRIIESDILEINNISSLVLSKHRYHVKWYNNIYEVITIIILNSREIL